MPGEQGPDGNVDLAADLPHAVTLFAAHLQEWQEAAEEGRDALATIQQRLAALEAGNTAGSNGAAAQESQPGALAALLKLAPSFDLQQYVASTDPPPSDTTPLPADELHSAYLQLQSCIYRLRQESAACNAAWERAATATAADTTASSPAPPAAAAAAAVATAEEEGGEKEKVGKEEGAEEAPHWRPAEWALVLSSLAGAVAKSTEWMEKSAAAVSLASPAEEVASYVQLWALQPLIDDSAAAAVIDAALEAQRRRERRGGGGGG